ncbi:MAG: hypothetical protein KBG28_17640 [Kofleriaceae bacterium]|jgi:hypothetical protein|nr:hypothetical protein [Kofleriaceae bacterium]MBP9205801.1 hypothetical protein [Kofleriaceae bacterium]
MPKPNRLLTSLLAVATLLAASPAVASVYVKYYNKDSKKHVFDATCSGSKYKVEFNASTTGAATIQGSSPCVVKHDGGEITLKGDEKIEIKDGVIKIVS